MATILDTIVAKKHEEVAGLRRQGLPARTAADAPRGFIRALCAKPGVAIIAEAKKASPSKGLIEPDFDPVQVAKNYQKNGATAISVLTDRHFFQGELDFLISIRKKLGCRYCARISLSIPCRSKKATVPGQTPSC